MKIVVFGGTGKTGKLITKLLVEQNHQVVLAARNIDATAIIDENIQLIKADVLMADQLDFLSDPAIDHVIIALGSKELWGNTVRSEGTKNILAKIKALPTKPKVHLISAAGVGESKNQLSFMATLFAKLLLPSVMAEHESQEQALIGSGLNYRIVRPSGLIDKTGNTDYQIIRDGKLPSTSIDRAAVAQCILDGIESFSQSEAVTITQS